MVNDIGMAFHFGIAAKEIAAVCLPGGSLRPVARSVYCPTDNSTCSHSMCSWCAPLQLPVSRPHHTTVTVKQHGHSSSSTTCFNTISPCCSHPSKALNPIISTVGGIVGPVWLYFLLAQFGLTMDEFPCPDGPDGCGPALYAETCRLGCVALR